MKECATVFWSASDINLSVAKNCCRHLTSNDYDKEFKNQLH